MTTQNRGYDALKALAREQGCAIPDLLVLARQNDPFFVGSETQTAMAEWFADLWREFGYTTGVHLRRVHYQLVSQPSPRAHDGTEYLNTEGCWQDLCLAGKYARILGKVAADAFEDHRNPAPRLLAPRRWSPAAEPDCMVNELEPWTLPEINSDLYVSPFRLPEPVAYGYDYEISDQPYLLEVWVEKSTQDDVLLPICRRYGAALVTSAGFQSITAVVNLLQRVAASDKPARVFFISDFDPAGEVMPVGVARQIEYWLPEYAPGAEVKLTPVALTREQVQQYRLPRVPVKDSDRRKAGFEERFGEGAVELDALEALHPGVLGRLVAEALAPYWDMRFERRMATAADEARGVLREAWEEATGDYQEELDLIEADGDEVLTRYKERLEVLDAELQEDLAPLKERLKVVRQAVQVECNRFAPDLPERPEPDTDPGDEQDWLFDAGREYLEQLAVYKARKNGAGVIGDDGNGGVR